MCLQYLKKCLVGNFISNVWQDPNSPKLDPGEQMKYPEQEVRARGEMKQLVPLCYIGLTDRVSRKIRSAKGTQTRC